LDIITHRHTQHLNVREFCRNNSRLHEQEGVPLLSTHAQRALTRRPVLLATLALGAVVALCGTIAMMRSSSASILAEKYNLPDGVEPEDQLSFVKAVKAHENTATKLDDVASRQPSLFIR
jgi:hypothetical protein